MRIASDSTEVSSSDCADAASSTHTFSLMIFAISLRFLNHSIIAIAYRYVFSMRFLHTIHSFTSASSASLKRFIRASSFLYLYALVSKSLRKDTCRIASRFHSFPILSSSNIGTAIILLRTEADAGSLSPSIRSDAL